MENTSSHPLSLSPPPLYLSPLYLSRSHIHTNTTTWPAFLNGSTKSVFRSFELFTFSQSFHLPYPHNFSFMFFFCLSVSFIHVSVMADLLRLLLRVAEKAANVARVCRQEALLFQLLVQEKTGKDKNKKFVQDFKTLADVVIQEMIRHDVGTQVKLNIFRSIIILFYNILWVIQALSLNSSPYLFSLMKWLALYMAKSQTSLKMD